MSRHWKQFIDLREEDFARHPIWIGCHGLDQDEPWYEETDEESFRPWKDALPAHSSEGVLLVRAWVCFANGNKVPGFLTPSVEMSDMGMIQPHVFLPSGEPVGFWEGMFPRPEDRTRMYDELDAIPTDLFPATARVDGNFITTSIESRIEGFYSIPDGLRSTPDVNQ